jgi:Uma2 family endonuclease
MTTPTKLMTADEFEARQENDECFEELIDGEVISMPHPGPVHGAVSAYITAALLDFVDANGLGLVFNPVGFKVRWDPDWLPGPDVAWVSNERLGILNARGTRFEAAPDLAVEVFSPGNTDVFMARKAEAYLGAGASRVWLVRPALREVTVWTNDRLRRLRYLEHATCGGESSTLTSDDAGFPIEGFELALARVFKAVSRFPEPPALA